MRSVLAAAAASAVALVPAVMIASPAQAAASDTLTITPASNYEGGNLVFRFSYTGTAAATFTLARTGGATGDATPDASVGNKDYDSDDVPASVSFPASSAANPGTATVVIHTVADTDAADETVILTATNSALSGGAGDNSTKAATANIYAYVGTAPTLSLSAPASVAESAGNATVVASLSGVLAQDVTIGVATTGPGTYGAGTDAVSTGGINRDYTAPAADTAITIPAGQLSGSVNIAINDDNLDEVDTQYVRVTPADVPAGITSVPTSVDIGITDNDATPTVSIGNAPAVAENTAASFPIRLSSLSERPLTVNFSTMDGTDNASSRGATGGDGSAGDYTTATNSSVSIPALTQTVYKTVATRTDTVLEGTENFTAMLSTPGPSGALTLGSPVTATATINDAATLPVVAVTATLSQSFVEGASGTSAKEIAVTATLPASRETPVTLAYKFVDGTAINGIDYKGVDGTITVPTSAGTSWSGVIPVSILGDTSYENPNENFSIVLTSPNSTLNLGSATPIVVTITDVDDVQPTWSVGNATVTEGNTGTATAKVPVYLSSPASVDTVFSLGLTDGTATEAGTSTGATVGANDYDYPTNRSLTIPAGSTSGWFEIPVNPDTVYERDETFVVSPTQTTSGGVSNTQVPGTLQTSAVTITNDDAKPSITFNNLTGNEGSLLRVNGTVEGLSQYEYKVGFAVAGGQPDAATAGKDYDAPANIANWAVTVPRGSTGALADLSGAFPFDVYLTPDTIDEATESFTLTATESTPSPQGFTTSVGTYKITDDPSDVPPAVSIRDESIGEDEGSVDVHVDLTMVGDTTATEQTIRIPYYTVDGSAKAGQDYAETKGILSIAPGVTSTFIKVPVINDKLKEGNENFWVKLGTPTSPAGANIAKGAGEVIIKMNDGGAGGETPEEPGEPNEPEQPGAPSISAPAKVLGAVAVPITGQASSGATVELWGAPMGGGELKYITSTKAGNDGKYSFSRWIGVGHRFATQANDLNSEEITVTVQQNPVFVASSAARGKLTLAVQGNPRGEGQTVIVQRWVGGKWVNAWRGTTGSNNQWKATINAAAGSAHTLRAFIAGHTPDGLAPGYSVAKKVTIRR